MPDSIEAVNVPVPIAALVGDLQSQLDAATWDVLRKAYLDGWDAGRKSNLSDRPREMRVRIAQTGNPSFFWVSDSLGVRAKTPAAARDEALADAQRFAASIGHVLKVEE